MHINDNINGKLGKFFKEVIQPDLPHASIQMATFRGSMDNAGFFEVELSVHDLFRDSVYEYNGPNDFLHFTSVQSLNSILNNGFVRSSEFRHLSDRHELAFALKAIEPDIGVQNDYEIESHKETIFSISLCEFSKTTLTDQFMWMQYANAAKGVALRIKLHFPERKNFAIGKVIYGENGLDTIKNIVERAKVYWNSKGLLPSNFKNLLLPVLAYHKVGAFSNEKEVRLLFNHPKSSYREHEAAFIFQDINAQNNLRYFYPIFLKEKKRFHDPEKNDQFNLYKEHVLTIEITDIYFGRNIDPVDITDFSQYFNKVKRLNEYNYNVWRLSYDNEILRAY